MPRVAPQPRVLRVGIVQNGAVAVERLIPPGESATIGTDPTCTFSLSDPTLPPRHPLFTARRGGRYQLQLSPDAALALQRDGEIARHTGSSRLRLETGDRGKLKMGSVTVLFQFIDAPPVPAHSRPGRFRPRLVDEDDPMFLGILSTCGTLAAALMVYVSMLPVVELVTYDEAAEFFVHDLYIEALNPDPIPTDTENTLAIESDTPSPTEPEPEPEVAEVTPEPAPAPEPTGGGSLTPAEREMQLALATQQRRQEIESQSAMLSTLIRSRDGDEGSIFRGEDGLSAAWDARIAGVGAGGDVAGTEDTLGIQGARDQRATNIDGRINTDLGGGGGGGPGAVAHSTRTEAVVPTSAVEMGPVSSPEDTPTLSSALKSYARHVRTCYEQRLKEVPNLEGRLVLGLVIEGGSVVDAYIDENTTRDSKLESCVTRQALRWTLRGVGDAEATMPFSLTPGN